MSLKIVILDDSSDKLQFAHGVARDVLVEGWEFFLMYIEVDSTLSSADLALQIIASQPQIVVLDNTLMCAVTISGLDIGRELRQLGYHGPIIANTYGISGWDHGLMRRAWLRIAQTDLGAGSFEELEPAIRTALSRLTRP